MSDTLFNDIPVEQQETIVGGYDLDGNLFPAFLLKNSLKRISSFLKISIKNLPEEAVSDAVSEINLFPN